MKKSGIVKKFFVNKGEGILLTDDGEELSFRAFQVENPSFREGDRVVVDFSQQKNRAAPNRNPPALSVDKEAGPSRVSSIPASAAFPLDAVSARLFWGKIVARLIDSGMKGQIHPGLAIILNHLQERGLETGSLRGWLPGDADVNTLREINTLRSSAYDPGHPGRNSAREQVVSKLSQKPEWRVLTDLFNSGLNGPSKLRSKGGHGLRKGKQKHLSIKAEQPVEHTRPAQPVHPDATHKPATSQSKKENRRKRLLAQIAERQSISLAVPSLTDWAKDYESLTICIDETWLPEQLSTGVISAVVWAGTYPDPDVLPIIGDHGFQEISTSIIPEVLHMLQQERALPIVLPLTIHRLLGDIKKYHDAVIEQAILLILGWLLPRHGAVASVRVLCDRYEDRHHRQEATEYYRGLLAASPRYERYRLQEVRWLDTERCDSYIPYADALGYIALQNNQVTQELAEKIGLFRLPGYVPLSLDLVPRLDRLEFMEEGAGIEAFLELAADIHGTELHRAVLTNLRERAARNPQMGVRLLRALDGLYLAKQRNLRRLQAQFDAVRFVVPEIPPDAGLRPRLLWTAIALQNANHDGDPERVAALVREYQPLRVAGLENDPELVAHCDLNVAVHLADRFDFEQALILVEDVVMGARFPFLPLASRGRLCSSMGQYQAMTGDNAAAEESFVRALAFFDESDLPADVRAGEKDQTAVYRAINAIDAGDPNARHRVEDVIGPLEEAARELGGTKSGADWPYHHHLLLRALYFLPNCEDAENLYLNTEGDWEIGSQHPWPLIYMYRGLLLYGSSEEKEGALDWFKMGYDLAAGGGATLKLVASMIATAAACCFPDEGFQESARGCLAAVSAALPASAEAVASLQDILDAPSEERIDEALYALPFNYH